ncbi:MAG: DUF1848 domain-containing protein [Deltaproteobacteria bacterium]|nr:DUF1848 domain-containing protein [Deltaproteobacteria bacterium]
MPVSHQPPIIDVEQTQVVLSASRRTDLAACFPDYFIAKLQEYPPERVHTIVVWTKNPHRMLTHPALRSALERYRQLYVHLTITGLGGSVLEPRIPAWQEVAAMLPSLVDFVGDARRISWRFDPIIRAVACGALVSNYGLFSTIAHEVSRMGVPLCRTSWVEPYAKVQRRLAKRDITLQLYSEQERREQARELICIAEQHGMRMQFCSVPGFSRSRCIDGELLSELHPDGLQCSRARAKGQRPLCGCTHSIDIGWYSQKCPHGCLYCYGEPLLDPE